LSRATIGGLLRNELGFEGLVLSDDLNMKAIANRIPVADAAVAAITAGADSALLCSPDIDVQAAACEAIVRAVESGVLAPSRVDEALARHRRARALMAGAGGRSLHGSLASPMSPDWRPLDRRALRDLVGTSAHGAIAEEIGRWV